MTEEGRGARTEEPGGFAEDVAPGMLGGLAGGALLSVAFLALEKASGEPSDLVRLERQSEAQLGLPRRDGERMPGAGEQVFSHGGHLALSAASGLAYAPLRRAGLDPIPAGLVLGLGFYTLAWGVAGPALGVTRTPREEGPGTVAFRLAVHATFGVVTALVAERLRRASRT